MKSSFQNFVLYDSSYLSFCVALNFCELMIDVSYLSLICTFSKNVLVYYLFNVNFTLGKCLIFG
jgi:hypothetical protein